MNPRQRPWLASGLVHGALLAAVLVGLAVVDLGPQPLALRMRLVGASGTSGASAVPGAGWWKAPGPAAVVPGAAGAPEWSSPTADAVPVARPTVPANLDELLGSRQASGASVPPAAAPSGATGSSPGWTSPGGQGYQTPPLPPPQLVPPSGARWSLRMAVAGAGGPALTIWGLESGHPELDRWLEAYLRTVSFPPSPDGQDYQVAWSLNLDTGRPQ